MHLLLLLFYRLSQCLCCVPSLLFLQVRFFEVSEEELEQQRSAFSNGQLEIKIEQDNFSMRCVYVEEPDSTSASFSTMCVSFCRHLVMHRLQALLD